MPTALLKELEKMARSSDRPKSYLVRKALEEYLEEQADCRIALERLREETDEIISSSRLRKRLASGS